MEIRITDPVPHLRIYQIIALIPNVQILWVGPEVCSRHGMMTFLHHLRGTLSFYCYREIDAVTGDYVRKIRDAAVEIIRERKPSGLVICTICQGAILATDENELKKSIEKETGVPVEYMLTNRLYMHSAQKGEINKLKPEQVLFSFLKPAARDRAFSVNILDRFSETEESDLHAFLYSAGVKKIRTLPGCCTPEEYQQLASSHLNVVTNPAMRTAAEMMEEQLGIPWADMSKIYNPPGLAAQYEKLLEQIGGNWSIYGDIQILLEEKVEQARCLMEGHSLQMHPMGTEYARELSRWLQKEGFAVQEMRGRPGSGGLGNGRPPRRGRPPGMPTGLSPIAPPSEVAPRPVTFSACIRILDLIMKTAEDVL